MNNRELLAEIERCEELEALGRFLQSLSDQEGLTGRLFDLLRTVVEYETSLEWLRAVHLCESLAIIGWGDHERVDALSRFNGDCWETFFTNSKGEHRFRFGRWKKLKAGWTLFNPEYHFSDDLPDMPSKSWKEFAGMEFPVVDLPRLPSQRNYKRQMPIVMGTIGGASPVSNRVFKLKRELTDLLIEKMRPSVYGEALEQFYLTLHCPGCGSAGPSGLTIGAFRSKQKAFYCELHFDPDFASFNVEQEKEYFRIAIEQAVDALEAKLLKNRLQYDLVAFRADVQAAFETWRSIGGSKR